MTELTTQPSAAIRALSVATDYGLDLNELPPESQPNTVEQVSDLLGLLTATHRNLPWYIGDVCLWAEEHVGQDWSQSLAVLYDYQLETVKDFMRVCRAWPQGEGRMATTDLSYNHHRELCSTIYGPPTLVDRIQWQQRAFTEPWKIVELRRRLKERFMEITPPDENAPGAENEAGSGDEGTDTEDPFVIVRALITPESDITYFGNVEFDAREIVVEPGATLTIEGPARIRTQ